MPVDVRNLIAKLGQVDLMRLKGFAQCFFNDPHDVHDMASFGAVQVRHFGGMIMPDYPRETGVVWVGRINNPEFLIVPKRDASGLV